MMMNVFKHPREHSCTGLQSFLPSVLLFLLVAGCQTQTSSSDTIGSTPPAGKNHLAGQSSPYLLQHANNPVDWYPWGEEALAKAQAEDKLLIISVGYAACHWCHVMEHESFEDTAVARVMNEHFVSIKVDREERPDIDDVYMNACQLSNQRGCGWPLNAVALPDGRPVWAGTYFPKEQWLKVLQNFIDEKANNPEKMADYATRMSGAITEMNTFSPPAAVDIKPIEATEIDRLADDLLNSIDFARGGTQGSPKFPMPILHEFLLTYHHYTKNERALKAVITTLNAMADGGIYDHLEGGFARYSTDADWKVPHFEKMLYDNGQLVSLYSKAYQVTKDERYARVIRQTLDFIEAKLTDQSNVFYASLDADTEGEEGKTYVWTKEEIKSILQDEQLTELVSDYFSVTDHGNWEETNILLRKTAVEKLIKKHEITNLSDLDRQIETARKKLLAERQKRAQPGLDDKSLTAWNALMISGYVDAYRALGDEVYRQKAINAADFLAKTVVKKDGQIFRNYKNGKATINGFLDDAALLALCYFEVYQITFNPAWLDRTKQLIEYTNAHYYNSTAGLYNYTSDQDPPLAGPNIPVTDQVIPAGNSIMARLLYQYGTVSGDQKMTARAEAMFAVVQPQLSKNGPRSFANWAKLGLEIFHPTYEIAIVGKDAQQMRDELTRNYLPNVLVLGSEGESELELLKNKFVLDETYLYVCYEKACRLPVQSVAEAVAQLE